MPRTALEKGLPSAVEEGNTPMRLVGYRYQR